MAIPAAASSTTGWAVNDAIRSASQRTGASFSYLLATAKVESDLDPHASSSSSSAAGLFQFIDQTWLGMMKQAGPSLGYGRYADAITRSPSGLYQVADAASYRAIMALRSDPTANAAMAGAFTQNNAAQLKAKLGRAPSDGELYIAHFLGSGGAAKLIARAGSQPDGIAADAFPNAAAANQSIFFERSGRPRSFAEVYGVLVGRFETARTSALQSVAALGGSVPTGETPARAPGGRFDSAQYADAAYQTSTARNANSPIFEGLFQSDAPRAGVSRFITDLWHTRPHVAAALSGAVAQAAPGSIAATDPTRAAELFTVSAVDAAEIYGKKT